MKKVVQRLAINQRKLYRHFPKLCRSISEQYASHQKVCHLKLTARHCQEVRQITIELDAKQINPTASRVTKLLTKPAVLLSKDVQKALHQVRCELGWEK